MTELTHIGFSKMYQILPEICRVVAAITRVLQATEAEEVGL